MEVAKLVETRYKFTDLDFREEQIQGTQAWLLKSLFWQQAAKAAMGKSDRLTDLMSTGKCQQGGSSFWSTDTD